MKLIGDPPLDLVLASNAATRSASASLTWVLIQVSMLANVG
jgi:hypothetical protein